MLNPRLIALVATAVGTAAATIGTAIKKKYTYDEEGYNASGYDRHGFDKDGYNKHGYNKDGYNSYGYDSKGYDKNGYNKEGFDNKGYDKQGYNANGYDKNGYDKKGYDRYGYNINGYNCNGFNRSGYDKKGYNARGKDIGGNSKLFYASKYKEIEQLLNKTKSQMNNQEFSYALHDIRVGLEIGIKCIIQHLSGEERSDQTLSSNITYCKEKGLLDKDFVEKLYSAKNHCNEAQHDSGKQKEYNQVYFSYKVLENLSKIIKEYLI